MSSYQDEIVTFGADTSQLEAAYDAFLKRVKAGVQVPFAASGPMAPGSAQGPAGPSNGMANGRGGAVNNITNTASTNITNNGNTVIQNHGTTYITNNVVNNGGAASGSGQGAGQGGSPQPATPPNQPGPQSQLIRNLATGYALQIAASVGGAMMHAASASAMATDPIGKARAEQGLQSSVFGVPIIGPILDVATAPMQMQTSLTIARAEQQAQQNAGMQGFSDYQRQQSFMGAAMSAGPLGSVQYRATMRKAQSLQLIQQDNQMLGQRRMDADREKQLKRQQARASGNFGFDSDVLGLDTEDQGLAAAQQDYSSRTIRQWQQSRETREVNETLIKQEGEQDAFQVRQTTVAQQNNAEVQRLRMMRKFATAQAFGTGAAGLLSADSFKRQGMDDAARAELESTKYQLMQQRNDIMLEGSAQAIEGDAGKLDLSGSQTSYRKISDNPEALGKIEELLNAIVHRLDGK